MSRDPTPNRPADLPEASWQELVDVTDEVCDLLDGVHPLIALAAIGNVACSIWQSYGETIPHGVMRDWLKQIFNQTVTMHRPHTKH